MTQRIEFIGIASGDNECFCWDVDAETFERIEGYKPTLYNEADTPGLYRLYPAFWNEPNNRQRARYTVIIEPVE